MDMLLVGHPTDCSWSYSQVTDGNEDLYTCNSDGTSIVKLLDSPSNESFPMSVTQWSIYPVSTVSFAKRNNRLLNSYEIFVLNLLTDEVKALTNNNYLDVAARWSPDGSKIAFLSQADGGSEIYVMNADGSDVKKVTITDEGSYATFPSWRPLIKPLRLNVIEDFQLS
ncbi:MAG: DPP IV N-terminal domain-containing protein [Bacillus subtilis]|nr:DPP IV N-terminal domain-containing protein [Bacillus subtilis]